MPSSSSRNDTRLARRTQPNKGKRSPDSTPFWRRKSLDALTAEEWESLCDRCGRCCMVKLEDEDTGEIFKTDIACKLFDAKKCTCASYSTRHRKVDDCLKLTPESVRAIKWLPATCAYRLVAEGKPLRPWHPLVSGSPDTVHEAGISVKGRVAASENTVRLKHYVDHIVDWDDA